MKARSRPEGSHRANRLVAIAGSLLFLVVAPGTVAGLVPYRLTRWQAQAPFFGLRAVRVFGLLLLVAGAAGLLECFARFAIRGRGTPAPVLPTRELVVSGLYRHVRNPMYLAVLLLVVGQGLLLGSALVLQYAALVWVAFHAFVVSYEEPVLGRRHGAHYDTYRSHVHRWWPRLRPWPDTGVERSSP